MPHRSGSTAILVVIVLIAGFGGALLFGWWLPRRARERVRTNERTAREVLIFIAAAELDFRAYDRDGNHIDDFWTADVAGLYSTPFNGKPIALIVRSIAEADARPLTPLVPRPIPIAGYYFVAMDFDNDGPPPVAYRQDTDGTGKKIHHKSRFGYCAYPAVYGVTGNRTFIINEGDAVNFADLGGIPFLHWPSREELRKHQFLVE